LTVELVPALTVENCKPAEPDFFNCSVLPPIFAAPIFEIHYRLPAINLRIFVLGESREMPVFGQPYQPQILSADDFRHVSRCFLISRPRLPSVALQNREIPIISKK
jgi:hypothetical protein